MKKGKKTILIVEDEIPMLRALRDKLTREGFGVSEAKNGMEGLAVAFRDHPDLILLDVIMPVMDGLTMLKNLRADAWGKRVKVIMLSNLTDDQKANEAAAIGVVGYVIKSDMKIQDVVAKIRKELGT